MYVDEPVQTATIKQLEEKIERLTSGFNPQMVMPGVDTPGGDVELPAADQLAGQNGLGGLDALPPDVLSKIAFDFEPGSTDAARLAGASRNLHAFLQPRVDIDRQIALARRQIALLERL